jgi:hypothetical protein
MQCRRKKENVMPRARGFLRLDLFVLPVLNTPTFIVPKKEDPIPSAIESWNSKELDFKIRAPKLPTIPTELETTIRQQQQHIQFYHHDDDDALQAPPGLSSRPAQTLLLCREQQ